MSDEYLMALPNGYRLNQYEIVKVLGAGGFGVTYLARDTSLDKMIAIKEYMPSDFALRTDGSRVTAKSTSTVNDFQWGLTRFLEEARILAKFRHPNIVEIYQVFEANQTAYIIMEYEEGQTLAQSLQQTGALGEAAVAAIMLPILDGLQKVHALGFLHRDIKPGNIILRTHGGPVLLDFGAARQAVEAKSRSITSVVTEGFAPIEQYASNGHQGIWTDIYALGAVAYKCLTGETPPAATLRIRNDPMIPAATLAAGKASPQFLAAVDWALSPNEQDRPQTIIEWTAALKGTLDVEKTMLARVAEAPRQASQETRRMPVSPAAQVASAVTEIPTARPQYPAAPETPPPSAAAAPKKRMMPFAIAAGIVLLLLGGGAAWLLLGRASAEDRQAWAVADNTDTVDAYADYLRARPDGYYVSEARTRMATGQVKLDEFSWWWASKQNTPAAYQYYMQQYPTGLHFGDAKTAVTRAQHAELVTRGQQGLKLAGYYSGTADGRETQSFSAAVRAYQRAKGMAENGSIDDTLLASLDQNNAEQLREQQLQQERESSAYGHAIAARDRQTYQRFLASFPSSTHADEIRQRMASCRLASKTEDAVSSQLVTAKSSARGVGDAGCVQAQQQATQALAAQCTTGRLAGVAKTTEERSNTGSILGLIKIPTTCTISTQAQCETTRSVSRQMDVCG
jgi:serine/threonine protein kinase/peptidoglycan hydrolase-like protein with peptidoglycan-binding domain